MKTVFITVAEDIIARNILHTEFWPHFKKQIGATRVILLVQPDREEYMESLFGDENVFIETYKRSKPSRFESALLSLARSGINTHTNTWSKMRSYYRGDSSWLSTQVKRLHQITLGNFNWYKRFLRFLILKCGKNDSRLNELFNTYNPSLVATLSLTNFDFDVPVAREAKLRGIYVFGMVRSWDNLSSHGLLRVLPDEFASQNEFLVEMAEKYQAINTKKILTHIIGLPHYDFAYDYEKVLVPRDEFMKAHGIDPSKRIILYGAMGEFLYIHEGDIPRVLDDLIKTEKVSDEYVFLYRAHPKFHIKESTDTLNHVVFDIAGAYIREGSTKQDTNENSDLINAIYHSDLVITGASTIAIDAAILGKPVICIAFDGRRENVRYWESAKRFFDQYTHFEGLVETHGVEVAYSEEELSRAINVYLKEPLLKREERKEIIRRFVAPFDGHSGERLAVVLGNAVKQV